MSIVVVTIPGPAKKKFVSDLQAATDNAVSLVVVQERPTPSWRKRVAVWRTLSWSEIATRAYYSLRLRSRSELQARLRVFQTTNTSEDTVREWAAPTYHTADINSDATFARIQAEEPTVLAVWGSGLLSQRVVTLPAHALNLHFGISTAYRGAYANQRAVEKADWESIGTTIHYMNGRADSGAVLENRYLPKRETPQASFASLHDETRDAYVARIATVWRGESVATFKPDLSQSENLRLQDWTPRRRYRVAQRLQQWHRTGQMPNDVD